jgi:hypothetical protein
MTDPTTVVGSEWGLHLVGYPVDPRVCVVDARGDLVVVRVVADSNEPPVLAHGHELAVLRELLFPVVASS